MNPSAHTTTVRTRAASKYIAAAEVSVPKIGLCKVHDALSIASTQAFAKCDGEVLRVLFKEPPRDESKDEEADSRHREPDAVALRFEHPSQHRRARRLP